MAPVATTADAGGAVAQARRWQILHAVAFGERTVNSLVELLGARGRHAADQVRDQGLPRRDAQLGDWGARAGRWITSIRLSLSLR